MLDKNRFWDLYRKILVFTNKSQRSYYIGSREEALLNNWIKSVKKECPSLEIGDSFIREYLFYQFFYWEGKDTIYGKNTVLPSWILGKKAIERWKNKNEKVNYYLNLFLDKYNLREINFKKETEKILLYQEIERQRFYNKEIGFLNCLLSTFLYEENSKWCIGCNFKEKCKEIKNKNKWLF